MKSLKLLLVLTFLAFCAQLSWSHKTPAINSNVEIYAYHWRMPEEEDLYDWIFILDYYIEIDEAGIAKVKRRKYDLYPQVEFEYFSKPIPDSISQLIEMVDFSDLGSVYNFGEDSTRIYCGLTYILKFNEIGSDSKYFRYIPGSDINPLYLNLHNHIESFVKNVSTSCESFNIDKKIDYLIKHHVDDTSKFPRKLGTIKFKAPK